jgi:3-hydroxyisobutyrate dehydrogenase
MTRRYARSGLAKMGRSRALPVVRKGAILIESSTVSPRWVAEFARLAEQHGADLLDAPETGSRMQAESGQLSFLVGGKDTVLAVATPVLEAMSKEITHLGSRGKRGEDEVDQ